MMKNPLQYFSGLLVLAILLSGCSAQPTVQPDPTTAPVAQATAAPTAEPATAAPEPTPAATAETWATVDGGKMEFSNGATGTQFPGDLDPHSAIRFHLTVMQGQQMNITLLPEPEGSATLYISDSNGVALTNGPTVSFSQVLPATQEYYIEIRSLAEENITYSFVIDIPAGSIDPVNGNNYEPIDAGLCQNLANSVIQTTGVDFRMESSAPFFDALGGDAGLGCRISASGNGTQFASPGTVMDLLRNSVALGFTEQINYQADGPTGSSTAFARDMALMLVNVNWQPEMGVVCPSDQPIASCNLTPEQKRYQVQIDIAQYKANFSLDGHWQDAATGFSLDLTQEWKTIGGMHTMVADGGNKIDSLDSSITGMVKGQGADIQFQSSFASEPGLVRIEVIDPNTISWKIVQAPAGEFYLPAEATLTR